MVYLPGVATQLMKFSIAVWQVVKHDVLALFRDAQEDGPLPSEWRHGKIIPPKKPGKDDYTMAKA